MGDHSIVVALNSVATLLVGLGALTWIAVAVIMLAACRMAARSER